MERSFPVLHLPVAALPFRDNLEFLEAKLAEYTLLLECAVLRQATQKEEVRASVEELPRQAAPGLDADEQADCLKERLGKRAEEHLLLKAHNEGRLRCSGHVDLPFNNMAVRCGIDGFEQDVLWLLFFKTVSPDFRQRYEEANFNRFGHEFVQEIYIGNILQLLCPGSLSAQMEACRHFAVDAPLLAHHLVRFGRDVQECPSILQVELQIPQRVVTWISKDENTYAIDCPFRVERPEDRLEKVVLPQEQLDHVLSLVTHHETYLQKSKEWGLERTITYGRATAILEYGPPGTGKTLLARALSCHTGRPLVLLNTRYQDRAGNEQDLEERLATLFREAQLRKGIVFIDECERLCMETSPVLRPVLTELEHTDALVIMATNRPELLAPSLDRRFTLKIPFAVPDAKARLQIWQNHLEEVPLAPEVDLEYLSVAYPFAGGYIKNAALAAVNAALSRFLESDFLLRQEDLTMAARLQIGYSGGLAPHAELNYPRFSLKQSLLPAVEIARLERLSMIARNYWRAAARWQMGSSLVSHPEHGFKLLFCGASYATGLRAAEALAGELQMPMSRVPLSVALGSSGGGSKEQEHLKTWDCQELFSTVAGTRHLLVFADECGQLACLKEKEQEEGARRFFSRLRSFEGLAVVVTSCQRVSLPAWAQVFQESLCLGPLDQESRQAWWAALLGETAHGLDIEGLAERHDLPLEKLQAAVHRARLLAAAEGPDMEVGQEQLEAAIAALGTGLGRQGLLFG